MQKETNNTTRQTNCQWTKQSVANTPKTQLTQTPKQLAQTSKKAKQLGKNSQEKQIANTMVYVENIDEWQQLFDYCTAKGIANLQNLKRDVLPFTPVISVSNKSFGHESATVLYLLKSNNNLHYVSVKEFLQNSK